MEKREFLAISIGSLGGVAASSALASGPDLGVAGYGEPFVSLQSAASLDKTGGSKRALEQIELIMNAVSTQQDRIEFISDPIGYARGLGVTLDKEFASMMADEIRAVERRSAALLAGVKGGKAVVGSKDGTVLPVVMAVAAVVNAVAAVIAALSVTYVATKWVDEPL